ncbi:MAG: 3'-5' exonuclease [Planctomycetota bacterium]
MVRKRLDRILVIDVEATCWEDNPPEKEESEIIEIGICVVQVASRKVEGRESILIKPEYSRVSRFCTQLTTLTQSQVEQGISFSEACLLLQKKYCSEERVWASYGDYDRRQFDRQCTRLKIPYPFGPGHLNIKTLFALVYKLPHEVGMAAALEKSSLPLLGIHHRGVDDAVNIATLLLKIFPH